MFMVYKIEEICSNPTTSNTKINKPKKSNNSLEKAEEKLPTSTFSTSYFINNSLDSSKDIILESEKAAFEPMTRKDFLSKKIKFNINLIDEEKEKGKNTISKEKNAITTKKNEKNSKSHLTIENGVNEGRWDENEHLKFIEAINRYGNEWKEVQRLVGTRSSSQVRSHAQKFFFKLKAFKDSSLGIDFTSNDIKNFSDIISLIKEYEHEKQCNNILFRLNEKILESNLKGDNSIICPNKNEKIVATNNNVKTNNQIIHEEILNKANKEFIAKKKKKKIFKNISSNIKEKDETIKNKEAKKKYYNNDEEYCIKYDNNKKYNFLGDYACENVNLFEYETNDKYLLQFPICIKEMNTISLIDREYFC